MAKLWTLLKRGSDGDEILQIDCDNAFGAVVFFTSSDKATEYLNVAKPETYSGNLAELPWETITLPRDEALDFVAELASGRDDGFPSPLEDSTDGQHIILNPKPLGPNKAITLVQALVELQ